MSPIPSTPRWIDHLVAVLVSVHMAMVIAHNVPTPPRMDDAALRLPDVAQEIDRWVDRARRAGMPGSKARVRGRLIRTVSRFSRAHRQTTEMTRLWLRPIHSTQSWNMFGGTEPKRPRVLVVEVRPVDGAFEMWLDGRHRGTHSPLLTHRHRKVEQRLAVRGSGNARAAWAQYHADQWDVAHPERPAAQVLLWFAEIATPRPDGTTERRAREGRRLLSFTWDRPS